jgi:hypothetical protein
MRILIAVLFTTFAGFTQAGLIFTLEGETGSSDFTLSATGSYQNFGTAATGNNSLCCLRIIRTDTPEGWWAPTGADWTGDGIFGAGSGSTSGVSGAISFDVTGDAEASLLFTDVLERSEVWWPGAGSSPYPIINSGEFVSITVAGALSFTSDILFDSLNTGIFTYEGPSTDTVTYVVRQREASVPTPATLALFGLGLVGLGWSRRKKV